MTSIFSTTLLPAVELNCQKSHNSGVHEGHTRSQEHGNLGARPIVDAFVMTKCLSLAARPLRTHLFVLYIH